VVFAGPSHPRAPGVHALSAVLAAFIFIGLVRVASDTEARALRLGVIAPVEAPV
jgi:hypothetical protein